MICVWCVVCVQWVCSVGVACGMCVVCGVCHVCVQWAWHVVCTWDMSGMHVACDE